ncbi:hypothetical protein [Streptomyces sp. NPDC001292]|uniref:hypothetical protein n=1 Tax=Streptomyces sp. NPDC001292 TaxID=3364558 RepID=UPI0036B990FD
MAFNLPSFFAAATRASMPPKSSAEVAVAALPLPSTPALLDELQALSPTTAMTAEQARLTVRTCSFTRFSRWGEVGCTTWAITAKGGVQKVNTNTRRGELHGKRPYVDRAVGTRLVDSCDQRIRSSEAAGGG